MPDPVSLSSMNCGIIGSGGHAMVVAALLGRLKVRLAAVYDTDPQRVGQTFGGLTIQFDDPTVDLPVHIAIGSNHLRRRVALAWEKGGRSARSWRSLVHPEAHVEEGVGIGDGTLVGLGAIVQAGATIGRHAIVNSGALVEHDCVIGNFAHIAPGTILGGAVMVGDDALIGIGSVVLPGIVIGEGATIGAGSVVTRPVDAGATVVGAPARPVAG